MTESLFIFGNGLGRSIDPDYFDLKTGLKRAWDKVVYSDTTLLEYENAHRLSHRKIDQ